MTTVSDQPDVSQDSSFHTPSTASTTLTRRDFLGAAGAALIGASLAFTHSTGSQAQTGRAGTIPVPGTRPTCF